MTVSITTLDETGSTNDWLLARAADLPDGHWVRAERQTAGRGRRGRAWVARPGNLFASVLVRPRPGEGPMQQLSFVAALALDAALRDHVAAERLAIKWPNDVQLDGAKAAGILLERSGDAVVVGIGVNLADAPDDVERPAISLAGAGVVAPSPAAFVQALAARFAAWRGCWGDEGFVAVRAAWLERAAGLGAPIIVRLGDRTLNGDFVGLAADGALELRQPDGRLVLVHAGEVFALGEKA